jgi:hypothetical protein
MTMYTSVAGRYDTDHNAAGIVWTGTNIVNQIFVVFLYGGVLYNPNFPIGKRGEVAGRSPWRVDQRRLYVRTIRGRRLSVVV